MRQFAATNAVTFTVYGALAGATFLLPAELQVGWGYSPLASGLALLPLTVIMLMLSARSGQLAGRIGPRLQMSVGPMVTGAGLAMLDARLRRGPAMLLHVLPAVIVLGARASDHRRAAHRDGDGPPHPREHSGIASAVNNDAARFGGLLALAALPALAGITGADYMHPDALGRRIPDRGTDRGRCVRRRRAARRAHHHQPPAGAPPSQAHPCPPHASIADSRHRH